MTQPLASIFRNGNGSNSRLTDLMRACRNRFQYRKISVVVVGCGDAFINRYWPKMQQLVYQQAIKLIVADQLPLDQLASSRVELAQQSGESGNARQLEQRYHEFHTATDKRPSDVMYLNLQNQRDRHLYDFLTTDIVFVLVPDDIHVICTKDWLDRSVLVIIEKPYDRDIVSAQRFEQDLAELVQSNGNHLPYTKVVCIDHCLAKISSYIFRRRDESLKKQIGAVRKIEFSLCESGGVEPWRAPALEAGMMYDLLCHVLAQASPFINLENFLSQSRTSGSKIMVARHKDCPIKSESYAHFHLPGLKDHHDREITLSGCIGKGVGKQDQKFLRIVGEYGTLYADFSPGADNYMRLQTGSESAPLFEIGKGHGEMLDSIFEGRFMREPVGGIDGKTAVNILQILTNLRSTVSRLSHRLSQQEHDLGLDFQDINTQAVSLF